MSEDKRDVKAAFLGPKAENHRYFEELMQEVFRDYVYWRRNFHPEDERVIKEDDKLDQTFQKTTTKLREELFSILEDLKRGVPLHSPRHLGDMVSDQFLAAQIGYIAALLYNQNNVTGRVSPVTTRCEFDYIDTLAEMIGFDPVARSEGEEGSWGHLASGGTAANMEALWAARNLKFYPVSLKLLSEDEDEEASFLKEVTVSLPNGETGTLRTLSVKTLLNLRPEECYELREKAIAAYKESMALGEETHPRKQLDEALESHSVQQLGVSGMLRKCDELRPDDGDSENGDDSEDDSGGLKPKIFVPRTNHYCWKKAADVLGLGQDALVEVDVDDRFRLEMGDLREKFDPDHPTLMVVGVAGTTEEGAFDPLDKLRGLRKEMEQEHGHSFWLHADAAWGGYFASLLPDVEPFRGPDGEVNWGGVRNDIESFFRDLIDEADVENPFRQVSTLITADWSQRIYALSKMDSVVVDPHKMGYIPYPAGAVLFADARARDAVSHDVPYLAWEDEEEKGIERKFMGRWTLEGSRPGTSAVACYLSQSLLPHDREGHGKVVAQTMITAQRLLLALKQFNASIGAEEGFKIVPLCQPETNVLCYLVAAPGIIQRPQFLNDLSGRVFDRMTVKGDKPVSEYQYFISDTSLSYDDYENSINNLLEEAGIPKENSEELEGENLTVLRSVVMNPLAFELDQTFFQNFWEEVATQAREALPTIMLKIIKDRNQRNRLPVLWIEDEKEFEAMRQSMEVEASLGQYFKIEQVSQPGDVEEVLEDFRPQVCIVDLNLTGADGGVDLRSGLQVIDNLRDRGVDDIIVYSQYLREGAGAPEGEESPVRKIIRAELEEGKNIPNEFLLDKSADAETRRAKDADRLLRKIVKLIQ